MQEQMTHWLHKLFNMCIKNWAGKIGLRRYFVPKFVSAQQSVRMDGMLRFIPPKLHIVSYCLQSTICHSTAPQVFSRYFNFFHINIELCYMWQSVPLNMQFFYTYIMRRICRHDILWLMSISYKIHVFHYKFRQQRHSVASRQKELKTVAMDKQ